MSIVPKEVLQDIRETWPAREMGLLEYATERAAGWALKPMYAELHDATKGAQGYEVVLTYSSTESATKALDAIRALISPTGKIKGGESDGQG
jgi:hypothetical protein